MENECACDKRQQPPFLSPPYDKYSFKNCVTRTYDATKCQISVLELILKFPSMSTSGHCFQKINCLGVAPSLEKVQALCGKYSLHNTESNLS